MKKSLVLAAVSILVLPIGFSAVQRCMLEGSAPFASVALAGHTALGTFCECGTAGCICNPEELAGLNTASAPDGTQSRDHDATPVSANGTSGLNLGSGALMLALVLMLWTRMRA